MPLVERIKTAANQKGISIPEIAKEIGISEKSIYRWDQSEPSFSKVIAVANLLQVSLSWLATGICEDRSFDSGFVRQYNKLSDLDKEKIKYFMEISLIKTSMQEKEEMFTIYKTPETHYSMVQEAPGYYQTKQNIIAILGYVAAGEPIEGISIPLGYIPATVQADYALIAKGHSMEPIILDGEYIFVKKCDSLEFGDLGIFYINGDVTCKKYHPQSDCLILQSLNPDFKPFKYSLNEQYNFKIQGKVILTSTQKGRFS